MFNIGLYIAIILSTSLATAPEDSCSLNIVNSDLIVVDRNFHIPLPINNSNYITFALDETFLIKCPQGRTNALLDDQGEQVVCKGGSNIFISRTETSVGFSDIKCVENLPTTAKVNGLPCADNNGGIEVQIGFDILQNFATAYTVCFDNNKLVPLYAIFNASFPEWGLFSNQTKEHVFIDDGHLYGDIDIYQLYSNQKKIFEELGLAEYITDDVHLVQGQVLPSYLFSYPLEGYAAFDYANVAPQWNTLLNQMAAFADVFITGYMLQPPLYRAGTSGVATLTNGAGEVVELYLSNGKVPVPRWLWYTYEGSFTIYGYNNPYYEASEVEAEFKEMCEIPYSFLLYENMLVGVCWDESNVSEVVFNKA